MTAPSEDTGNGRVSYTVKELLGNLEKKIDKLLEALEHKADLAQLTQARKDIQTLEGRIRAVEKTQESSSEMLGRLNKIIDTQAEVKAALTEQASGAWSLRASKATVASVIVTVVVIVATVYINTH